MNVRLTALDPNVWVKNGSSIQQLGIFNELNSGVFLIDPAQIAALGGSKSSQLSDVDFLSLRLSPSLDITASASAHLNSSWSSNGWSVGSLQTFLNELKTWCENHFGSSSINEISADVDLILMQGKISNDSENTYTVALAYFGDQGIAIGASGIDQYVTLLLDMEGETIVDRSSAANNLTVTSYSTSTVKKKYGYRSALSTNFGSGRIQAPVSVADFGTQDFTVEGWYYFTLNNVGYQNLWSKPGFSDYNGIMCYLETNNTLVVGVAVPSGGAWSSYGIGTGYVPPTGVWIHVAVVRNGATLLVYVDGTLKGSSTIGSNPIHSTNNNFYVGYYPVFPGGPRSMYGYVDDFRVSVGIARYTSNFAPPGEFIASGVDNTTVPAPSGSGAYTTLRLDMEGASIVDLSSGSNALTVSGYSISSAQKKYGTSSALAGTFSTSRITAPYTVAEFGSQDFTVEGWYYFTANNVGYQALWSKIGTGDGQGLILILESTNALTMYGGNSGWDQIVTVGTPYVPPTNTWIHIAVVRYGSSLKIYIDGAAVWSGTFSGSIAAVTNGFNIGYYPYFPGGGRSMYGYIDDFRVSVGTARYTADFIPPAALTA